VSNRLGAEFERQESHALAARSCARKRFPPRREHVGG